MATTTGWIDYDEGAAPATPAAGDVRLYAKTDGLLYSKDDAGTETLVSGGAGGGAVATDAIWDAAGDLAVGSGANTAARLAIGNAGGVLARINGAVAWNAGTAFPTAATGDRYFRTDRGIEYYYDGTRWLSMQQFTLNHSVILVSADTQGLLPIPEASTIYLTSWDINAYVSTATTWVVTLSSVDTEFDLTTLDSQSTAAQSSAQLYRYTKALGTVIDPTASHGANTLRSLHVLYDEQAGTSTFSGGVSVHYRLIG